MKFEHTQVMNFEGALRGMRAPMNSWAKSDSEFGIYCEHEDSISDDVYNVANAWAEYELQGATFATEEDYNKEFDKISDAKYTWLWEQGAALIGTDHHSTLDLIGPKDMELCRRLINGGPEHRKFLRQIFVSVDITAPLYWWKEADTYQVGVTKNSTSTMHKLANTPITKDCFEMGDYCGDLPVGIYALAGCEEYLEEPDYSQPIQCGKLTICDTERGETIEDIHYSNITSREDSLYNECFNGVIHLCERLRQLYLETKDKRYWKELIRLLPNGWLQTRTVTMNYENLRSMYHQRKGHKLSEWRAFCEWVETLPYAQELIIS